MGDNYTEWTASVEKRLDALEKKVGKAIKGWVVVQTDTAKRLDAIDTYDRRIVALANRIKVLEEEAGNPAYSEFQHGDPNLDKRYPWQGEKPNDEDLEDRTLDGMLKYDLTGKLDKKPDAAVRAAKRCYRVTLVVNPYAEDWTNAFEKIIREEYASDE